MSIPGTKHCAPQQAARSRKSHHAVPAATFAALCVGVVASGLYPGSPTVLRAAENAGLGVVAQEVRQALATNLDGRAYVLILSGGNLDPKTLRAIFAAEA